MTSAPNNKNKEDTYPWAKVLGWTTFAVIVGVIIGLLLR